MKVITGPGLIYMVGGVTHWRIGLEQFTVQPGEMDLGFSSSQHLCALFKRHFGTTATQWRSKTGRP